MSDLISRLKTSNNSNKCNSAEIKFLEESDLSKILDRGFNEIYRLRPENPVLFLSKWLTREARAKELAKKYLFEEQKRDKLEQQFLQHQKELKIRQQKRAEQIKLRRDDENHLVTEIEECEDFWLGFNHICERLKTLIKATGCYVGLYDLKRKPVTEDDDETGHIHPSNTKVLRYIGWNDDHNFLDDQCLEQNQGVTFDLIFPQQKMQNQPGTENNEENKQPPVENQQVPQQQPNVPNEEKKNDEIQTLLIEDVVNENRMKFFREPRLGCYLALDLTYKSSMNYASLLSAIQCTKEYEAAKEAQEARKQEWKTQQEEILGKIKEIKEEQEKEEEARKLAEEKAAQEKAAQEAEMKAKEENANANNGENANEQQQQQHVEEKKESQGHSVTQSQVMQKKQEQSQQEAENPIEALEKQLTEWTEEPVKLADYDKEENKLYLCLDTMGQDRIFNEGEMDFIKKIGKVIRDSMEKLEQRLLEKDRDIRIQFLDLETKIKTQDKYSDEKSENLIDAAINQYYSSEEFKSKNITEEDEKAFEGDLVKLKYLKEAMLQGEFKDAIETFQQFEFVEFSKIFQNVLYFCRENPLDINEEKTNKIEWKKAKKYWSNIFNYISAYNPLGPKPEQIKNIYKLNKIKENLETVLAKRDEIKSYSQTLLMFTDFILHIIKVRHDDIIRRLCDIAVKKDRREQIIKSNAEIDEERQKIIEAAKANNPNVKIPTEDSLKKIEEKKEEEVKTEEKKEEEKKDEEKKEEKTEEKKEEKKEEPPKEEKKEEPPKEKTEEEKKAEENAPAENANNQQNNEEAKEGEELEKEKIDEMDSMKLAEELQKFDEEHQKMEVPPDVEYDIDNDYDIDQTEKDTLINVALQSASGAQAPPETKPKVGGQQNVQKPAA